MTPNPIYAAAVCTDAPLTNFSNCHVGILGQLDRLSQLPDLLAPARLACRTALSALDFFSVVIDTHHEEEERELFPAVLSSAQAGAEREAARQMIRTLTQEHRSLEKSWKALAPTLKKIAKGQAFELDAALITALAERYKAHATFEEQAFLPLAEQVLGRNDLHMAALGLSLHMRHAPRFGAHI